MKCKGFTVVPFILGWAILSLAYYTFMSYQDNVGALIAFLLLWLAFFIMGKIFE